MKKPILLSLLLGFLCVSSHGDKVLNVNYTAHLNPFLPVKSGKAAVGFNDSDFWNVYSRDGINGGIQSEGSALNLKWSDGVSMGADLYVTNAPGAWFTEDPDAMMQSYLYPGGGGNINSFFYNLPDGAYDVYVYAHGNPPGENAKIELRIGGNSVGEKSTSSSTNWDTGGWNEGGQYVVFRDVSINNAEAVAIISKGGISGLAVMNGVQFLQKAPVTNLVDKPLLNIDFGAASNQFLHLKVGPAAVGQTTSDIWNLYSRDGTNGEVLANNTLSNLVWSDGSGSIASLSVTNAAGAWYTLNPDPMFESYLYPVGRTGEIGAVLSNLHPGTYDVYVYAHGQPAEENGVIALSTPSIDYGTKQTSSATNWDGAGWTEGHEYVLFTNVQVFTNQSLSIVSKPGESGLSVINGVQLVRVSDDPGTIVDPIVILTQPQSVFVAEGIVPVLSVSATNSLPLSYQWTFNGSDLAGATNSSVSAANEGIYQVSISNGLTTVTSDAAQVWRGMLTDKPLLNIDFGAASNQFLHLKVGPAAVGQATSDMWNLYSRDGTNGTWLDKNKLLNLVWSDGATNVISLSLTNAAGAWYTLNPDPMFESYLYPASHTGNIEGQIEGLPPGVYSFYIYAHGQIPQENGVVQLSTESHQYGMRITSTETNWDSTGWHRGDEYVLFENVQIFPGESLFISSKPGLSGLAVLNGLQAIQNSTNPAAIQNSQLITILKHPESLIASLGSTAAFQVVATNGSQLHYQWFYNASIMSGQTNSTLVISNVTDASVGSYQVLVSSSIDAVLSVEAQLTLGEAVSHPLLNIDFGSADNPYFHTKTGPAAVGLSSTDFWNLYSRDDENGGWVSNGELSNLKWSDSTVSGIQLSVTNAAGAWFTLNSDAMFESYLYPLGRVGDVGAFLTKVPPGNYDLYVYAHGQLPEENAGVALSVGTNVLGTNYTSSSAGWDSAGWHEGNQFVRFKNVQVHANDLVSVVIKPGQSGLAVINGMQLVLNSGDVQTYSPVVADWTFEEGTPGTVMQVVKDWSGKGHDGVGILGQPQFVQSGPGADGSISGFFPSGNGGFGSGFRAQDSVDFNLGSEFTIEASINPGLDNNEANRGIVVGQDAASGRLVYALDYRSETRTVDFAIISANGDGLFVPAILPDDGRSHHIAGVFGGQEIRIYLDGILAASKPCLITPGIAPGGAARVTVGANDIGGYWFNGTLDRVRITAQALSPTEFFSESSQSNILRIVQGPADLTVAAGGTATFNVLAFGPQPLSYQWTFNTNNIPGATNSTLIITNVQSGDAGVYEVIVMSGTNHMQASALLTISDLNTPPVILQQPFSQTNYVGSSAQFSVVAEGSEPLMYLWSFNGSLLTSGTNNTLVITNLDLGDAGAYSVLVTNNYGSVTSRVAYLSVVQPDLSVPQITILSPESGTTTNDVVTVTGSVTDNVGTVRFEWFKNGQLVGPLPVTNGTFTLPNVVLVKGQNVLRFQAFDAAGNMGSATVYLNLEASRMLIISPVDSVQEGAPVTLPIYVKSAGDIGAITFTLNYDSRFLSNPELDFVKTQVGIFTQVNYASSNRIRATFALPGQTIAAGSNLIATVSFMTRSVPQDTTVPLKLDLQGVFNAAGDPITSGTEVKSTSLWIRQRNFIGDNNANDRLDVGDASIIMRLVSLLDPVRPWDVTGNDLNSTGSLDAGDIIRVLRTVVHIDPQPGETNHHSLSANSVIITRPVFQHEEIVSDAKLELYPDKTRVVPGEKVTFKVKLTSPNIEAVSGASFGLRYPANVLRLENENAIQAGTMVPSDAAWLWNLSPAQNDFSIQDGVIYMAFSSASGWGTTNDTLAELTFTALPGISERYLWTITATEITVTSGYNFGLRLLDVEGTVTGRDPVAATLGVVNFNPQNGGFQLQVQGELGAQYRIEVSEDLKTWNELGVQVNQTGSLNVSDPASTQSAHRYYRVTQID